MQGKAGFVRFAGALLALVLCALAPRVSAQSPEFYQLLSEINSRVKGLSPAITRGLNDCTPAMVDQARQAMQRSLAETALQKVIVEPLEDGAKVGISALGGGAIVTTYSMMKCAATASSAGEFTRCMIGEGIGWKGGDALAATGASDLAGAIAGLAWDKTWGAGVSAWDQWASGPAEEWQLEASGECDVKGTATWLKGRGGGTIRISIRASNCKCATGGALKEGSFRLTIPVSFVPSGSRQPGFTLGRPRDILVEATCCSNPGRSPFVYLYNLDGQMTGIVRPDQPVTAPPPVTKPKPTPTGPTTTTGPPPTPPPVAPPAAPKPKPKPEPVWPPAPGDLSKVCPECNVYLEAIQKLRAEIARIQQRQRQLQEDLHDVRQAKARAEADIRSATAELNSQGGTGGSAFDPSTGLTTESITQADGRVRIRTLNERGEQVGEATFRERRDLAAAKKQLEEAGKQLEKARADETRINAALAAARTEIERAEAAIRTQEALYEECIERCRRKVLFGEPPMGVAFTPPLQFLGGIAAGPPEALTVAGPPLKPAPTPATKGGKPAVKPKPQPPAGGGPGVLSTLPGELCPDCTRIARDFKDLRDELAERIQQIKAIEEELRGASATVAEESGAPLAGAAEREERSKRLDPLRARLSDGYRDLTRVQREFNSAEAQLKDCLAKCKAFGNCDVEVERVINIVGNNPFDARDPLRESASSSSSSSSSPSSCSTTLTPRNFLSCVPNACSFSTPIALTVSSGAVTLTPLNSGAPPNGPVTFCNGVSNSSNLNILGAGGHRCSIVGVGAALLITCQNNGGAGPGSCSSFCP